MINLNKFFLLVLYSFFMFTICSAGTIDPETPDEKYIEYGSKFKSVVRLCCFDGNGLSCGSAVVIDPEWIVTAAHVVENCHSWTASIGEDKYNLDKVILYPEYKAEVYGYHDIAIGHLSKKIELKHYPKLYENNDEAGQVCSIAGVGFTGTFITGISKYDGNRRAGSNKIEKIEKGVLVCNASKVGKVSLEYLICSGDSGGGLFIGDALAGINSSVVGYDGKSDSSYGDEGCHTRVSLYAKWIREHISAR